MQVAGALKQHGGIREDVGRRGEWGEVIQEGPYQPAVTGLLLLLSDLQPLPQQETLAARRGAGRGASRPGRGGVFVAGWRDLNGGQLEVLLGAGARPGREVAHSQPPLFHLPLAGHVPHAPHLEALAPERRG